MKVGILTYHSAHNYGAMLQAFALRRHLETRGHDAELIDFHPESLEQSNSRRKPVRSVKDLAATAAFRILASPLKCRYANFERFKTEHMRLSRRYRTTEELLANPPDYDAYICGSDQIWNTDGGVSPVNFLQFAPKPSRKISYAPSIGTETVAPQHLATIASLLADFAAISVREESARRLLAGVLSETPDMVSDPVFLLSRDQWTRVAAPYRNRTGYIAYYALETSPELTSTVKALSRILDLPVVVLGKASPQLLTNRPKLEISSGPSEFLGCLMGADLVVTNSFHGTAFSILFERPFVSIPHRTRNTRIAHILMTTGLEHRDYRTMLQSGHDAKGLLNMDFTAVRSRLQPLITHSIRFLDEALAESSTRL